MRYLSIATIGCILIVLSIVYVWHISSGVEIETEYVAGDTVLPEKNEPVTPLYVFEDNPVDSADVVPDEEAEVIYVDHPENVRAKEEADAAQAEGEATLAEADAMIERGLALADQMLAEIDAALERSNALRRSIGNPANSPSGRYLMENYGVNGRITEAALAAALKDPEYIRLATAEIEGDIAYILGDD